MKTKEKKLFTKKELQAFGEFARDEGKTQTLEKVKEKIDLAVEKANWNKKMKLSIFGEETIDNFKKELLSSLEDLGVEE